ncbi:hypothetical protein DSM106972_039410 [Dulcicalothrix desertica PCC 7102]|uniref:Uncharacterized protein n=1 Tax=Dulcicalothrix desertica PCC 7102 TaxID=232991 RepID=A0A3S1CK13_9CYAN|nr:hypothetical protein DSM106972_039410 [Dulcicalothrix desertica PCC 7102]TWH43371.1 hypothetical protein CAL7102_07086 [Dulcicalothrix desertica PCC 7102]
MIGLKVAATTMAPALAKATAQALPIPELAPVTMATLSFKFIILNHL